MTNLLKRLCLKPSSESGSRVSDGVKYHPVTLHLSEPKAKRSKKSLASFVTYPDAVVHLEFGLNYLPWSMKQRSRLFSRR